MILIFIVLVFLTYQIVGQDNLNGGLTPEYSPNVQMPNEEIVGFGPLAILAAKAKVRAITGLALLKARAHYPPLHRPLHRPFYHPPLYHPLHHPLLMAPNPQFSINSHGDDHFFDEENVNFPPLMFEDLSNAPMVDDEDFDGHENVEVIVGHPLEGNRIPEDNRKPSDRKPGDRKPGDRKPEGNRISEVNRISEDVNPLVGNPEYFPNFDRKMMKKNKKEKVLQLSEPPLNHEHHFERDAAPDPHFHKKFFKIKSFGHAPSHTFSHSLDLSSHHGHHLPSHSGHFPYNPSHNFGPNPSFGANPSFGPNPSFGQSFIHDPHQSFHQNPAHHQGFQESGWQQNQGGNSWSRPGFVEGNVEGQFGLENPNVNIHLKNPQVTVNKQHNFFEASLPHESQNIQIAQANGHGSSISQSASSVFGRSSHNFGRSSHNFDKSSDNFDQSSHNFDQSSSENLPKNVLENVPSSEIVSKPFLLYVPPHEQIFRETSEDHRMYKRSLGAPKYDLFNTIESFLREDESLFGKSSQVHHITKKDKRHAPLLRLMTDPNAKLDVSKTMENIGTVAKNSLEDRRAPMFHVRNMLGSVKSAVLSAMKIPPQDLIIPSQYKIVDTSKIPEASQNFANSNLANSNLNFANSNVNSNFANPNLNSNFANPNPNFANSNLNSNFANPNIANTNLANSNLLQTNDPIVGGPRKMSLLEKARSRYQEMLMKKSGQSRPFSQPSNSIREDRILRAMTPDFARNEISGNNMAVNSAPNTLATNGRATNAMTTNAVVANAMATNAMANNAMIPNAMATNAMIPNAMATNAMIPNAMATNAIATRTRARNAVTANEDPYGFMSTFQKVGAVLRESIKSGQETLQHMGDVAHSARKAISTARFSAPRVFLPYARAPVLQRTSLESRLGLQPRSGLQSRLGMRSSFGSDGEELMDKVMLVTPKLLDVKSEKNYNALVDGNPEFVGAGEIMDALGFSNPEQNQFSLRKIILHQKPLPELAPRISNIKTRSNFDDADSIVGKANSVEEQKYFLVSDTIDPENEDVQDTLETLDEVKEMVGAKNLKDLILKMKNDLSAVFNQRKEEVKVKLDESTRPVEEAPMESQNDSNIGGIVEEARTKITDINDATEKALDLLKIVKFVPESAKDQLSNPKMTENFNIEREVPDLRTADVPKTEASIEVPKGYIGKGDLGKGYLGEGDLGKDLGKDLGNGHLGKDIGKEHIKEHLQGESQPKDIVGQSTKIKDSSDSYFHEQVDNFLKNLFVKKYKEKINKSTPSSKTDPTLGNLTDETLAIVEENIKDIFGDPAKFQEGQRSPNAGESQNSQRPITKRFDPNELTESKESVGAGMPLAENLMKPFMGLPSKTALREFFVRNGDDLDLINESNIKLDEDESGNDENLRGGKLRSLGSRNAEMMNEELGNDDLMKENLKNENLKNENLKNENLKNENMMNENLKNENLKTENFMNENLKNENLKNENLKNENFKSEDLKNEELRNEPIVGAINARNFQKVFHEPLKIKPSAIVDDHGNIYTLLDDVVVGVAQDEDARSVTVPKKLLKPYMGHIKSKYYFGNKYYGIYPDDD